MLRPTDRIAFVGTPCQITAVKRAQLFFKHAPKIYSEVYKEPYPQIDVLKKYDNIKITIGLFCMENFYYPDFIATLEKMGIKTVKIKKMKIEKNVLEIDSDTEKFEILLRDQELKKSVLKACSICTDFISDLADVSIGSIGAPRGYSTVITRTEEGDKFLQDAFKNGYVEFYDEFTEKEKNKIMGRIEKIKNVKKEHASKNLRNYSKSFAPRFYTRENFDAVDSIEVSLMQNFYSLNNVTKNDLCTQCGICVAICPTNALEFRDSVPISTGQCDEGACGLCFALCPHNFMYFDVDKNEIFESLNSYPDLQKIYVARSTDEKLRAVAQNGGVVSSLIRFGIESNRIDVSVGVKNSRNHSSWRPEATYVKTDKDIIETAGSKYSACRTITLLK